MIASLRACRVIHSREQDLIFLFFVVNFLSLSCFNLRLLGFDLYFIRCIFAKSLSYYFDLSFYRHKQSHQVYTGKRKSLQFCNHVSWADFFIDDIVTGSSFTYLSSKLVSLGIGPFLVLFGFFCNKILFFSKKKGSHEGLFKFLKKYLQYTQGFIVYPEATHNKTENPLPLKNGLIQFAYHNRCLIQIVISHNKNNLVNKKELKLNKKIKRAEPARGVAESRPLKIIYQISEPIDPVEFDNYDDFEDNVKRTFFCLYNKPVNIEDYKNYSIETILQPKQLINSFKQLFFVLFCYYLVFKFVGEFLVVFCILIVVWIYCIIYENLQFVE